MYWLGLQREDCVVPGIVMAGANVQFLAIYLIKDNFPVLVELSPKLSPFRTLEEQLTIAEWCLRVVSFAIRTKALLDSFGKQCARIWSSVLIYPDTLQSLSARVGNQILYIYLQLLSLTT